MAKTDPLIKWETAALRESAARRRGGPTRNETQPTPSRKKDAWVTLRDAHHETGLPIETLRKWARRNHVPSEIRTTEFGDRRVVDLVAVTERATKLGRPVQPIPLEKRSEHPQPARTTPAPPPPIPAPAPTILDLRDTLGPPTDSGEPATETAVSAGAEFEPVDAEPAPDTEPSASDEAVVGIDGPGPNDGAPAGTMIVPIAAWDRMLIQLGNLHEAGQQLADARERAAKAETEAEFLKERLSELRGQFEPAQPADPPPPQPTAPTGTADPPEKLWRYMVRGWRDRHR